MRDFPLNFAEQSNTTRIFFLTRRTFNCGVGMVVAVDSGDLDTALTRLGEPGETAWHIGSVADGAGAVEFR